MAASGGNPLLHTGSLPPSLPTIDKDKEYEKILKITDEIFSGIHPRLKVPPQFVRKIPTRPLQQDSPVTRSQEAKTGASKAHKDDASQRISVNTPVHGPRNLLLVNGSSATASAVVKSPSSSRVVPKPASEIDPVLLTKSDGLVRAEIKLQRQRLEREIREQCDQRRAESRQKVALQDAMPDFDVSDVLARAFDIVKPVESDASSPSSAPVLSDDNSLYSSRAPDSPQPLNRQKPSPTTERAPLPAHSRDLVNDTAVDHDIEELRRLEALNPSEEQELQQDLSTADKSLPHQSPASSGPVGPIKTVSRSLQQQAEALEEPEYSPPAPDVPPMGIQQSQDYPSGFSGAFDRRLPDVRIPSRDHRGRRSVSPDGDLRIVRNHITSPAAPRPSQVASLARTRAPSGSQFREVGTGYTSYRTLPEQDLNCTSPEAPAKPLMPRKRRRLEDGHERLYYRRQAVDSSEPYVKEEPVSPPPFAEVPLTVRSRHPQDRPIYIDIASPRHSPAIERRDAMIREPVSEYDPYGRVLEYNVPEETALARTISRVSSRHPVRDDQDLRRVASLHRVRQPEYEREYIPRAASYAVVERPPQDRFSMHYEDVRRAGPVEAASPLYREAYYEDEFPTRLVGPPRRRIIVDEYGNQYYETPNAPVIHRVPSASNSHLTSRHWGAGAAPVADDYSREARLRQSEMLPPPTFRRVGEYPRPTATERRSYVAPLDERDPYIRGSSVQVAEHPKRPEYLDEPRERVLRFSSVRPPATRYNDPRELAQRMDGVPAVGREVSVFVDEEVRRTRDHVERPVYLAGLSGRDERYYDHRGSERTSLDGRRDSVNRGPQRF